MEKNKRKVAFFTLGCKVNQYETNGMAQRLMDKYEVVEPEEKADIYIINTCSVTNMSDRKSRQMIRRAKEMNKDAFVIVVGCYAEVAKEEIEKIDEVDLVLGNHQKVKGKFTVLLILCNQLDDGVFHLDKIAVDNVVLVDDRLRRLHAFLDKGVDALGNHLDRRLGHIVNLAAGLHGAPAQEENDFSNLLRLVANALHVCDHFQRGGNLAQIPRHRLLLQQQLHAAVFNVPLHLVNAAGRGGHFLRQGQVALRQRLGCLSNGFFTHGAHFDQFFVQKRKLLVKPASHHPNLPVI